MPPPWACTPAPDVSVNCVPLVTVTGAALAGVVVNKPTATSNAVSEAFRDMGPPQVRFARTCYPSWASHLILDPDASAGRRSRAVVSPYMVQRAQSTTVLGKRWSLQKLVWVPPMKVRN